ncbi:MAG: hypothetical protein AAF206_05250 [Bacteroidota bacterium]
MKNLRTFFVSLVMTVAVVSTGLGQETTTANVAANWAQIVPQTKAGFYQLQYAGSQAGTVVVNIYDKTQNQVHSERFAAKDLTAKSFNLRALPEGDYTFEVKANDGTYSQGISYSISDLEMKADFLPLPGDKKYQLVVNGAFSDLLYVEIRDTRNEILYRGYTEFDKESGRVFDLSGVNSEEVTFVIMDDFLSTEQNISLK